MIEPILYLKRHLTSFQIMILGFAGVIFVGGFILWLPFCSAPGQAVTFPDAVFTAATSVCVTGLSTVVMAVQWSPPGPAAPPGPLAIAKEGAIVIGITAAAQWIMNMCNNRMTYNIVRDIRRDAFERIEHLPLSYIDSHSHGDMVSRIIADVDTFADGLLMGFTQLFKVSSDLTEELRGGAPDEAKLPELLEKVSSEYKKTVDAINCVNE